ncbi:hypothetical protein SNE40_006354 [Patella caerulea]|uniref:Nudix hydrolase domain-containing protein n=1 Tax=Patella caerulea TaxID=87958 RepID=A0AAN8PTI7_PATCE
MAVEIKTHRDRYNGLTIDSAEQNLQDEEAFIEHLKACINEWRAGDEIRGLWVKINKQHSSIIPHLVALGFEFHHAQPGYVMMCQWLANNEPNGLPEYANQYIGVGGFVVNDKKQLLVIQEKYTIKSHWKLPGGHANCGEDLPETAQREVFEETGIKTEFVSLLCFRHQHQYRFGCSDIYFICLMKPVGGELKPCQQEIAKCMWMDVEEYMNHPDITDANRYIAQCYQNISSNGNVSITPERVINFNNTRTNNIYSVGLINTKS